MAIRPASILPFLKGTKPYNLYVLVVLMLVFTLNQKDRFLLGVTGDVVVKELKFGDYSCSPNNSQMLRSKSCDGVSCAKLKTIDQCKEPNDTLECSWDHTPLGLKYELLAGPLFTFLFTLATIPVGILASSRWVNRKISLSLALTLWSATTLATGFTHHYWQFLLTRISLGLFEAVCTPFASSIISDYFTEKFRGTALGFYNWGIYLGYSSAFAFNFVLNSPQLGWSWVYIIASIPGFIVALLMIITVKEPPRKTQDQSKLVVVNGRSLAVKLLRAYLNPALLVMCVAGGVRLGAGLVWAYNVKSYFSHVYCEAVDVGHYLTWVPLVGGTLGALLGGLLSDSLARFSGYKGRMWVLILSQIFAAPFLVGTLYVDSIPIAFMSLIPAYVIGEAWLGICLTVAIELVEPEVSPASISLFLFISNNISSVMPLLLPLLRNHYHLQRTMLILFPGLYVISAVLFSLSLCLLLLRDLCHKKDSDNVKLKSPGHVQQAAKQRRRRRKAQENSPLLQEKEDLESSDDSDPSDCGIFEEIDEREQLEAQQAVIIGTKGCKRPIVIAASVNDQVGDVGGPEEEGRGGGDEAGTNRDPRGGASVSVMSRPATREETERRKISGRRGRYGAVEGASSRREDGVQHHRTVHQPAPVVGSVSEWSVLSPSLEEEKRWLAESQEGI